MGNTSLQSHRSKTMRLRDNNNCYVCGTENPAGLGVAFTIDREKRSIRGRFTPGHQHQGFEGIVHGGIISALLDEAMVKLAFSAGCPAVTAEITVKLKHPVAPGDELVISGRITDISRRLITAEASIDRSDVTVAAATAKLLKVTDEDRTPLTMDHL